MSTPDSLRINRIEPATDDTLCVYFDAEQGFIYTPGQYISLVLAINGKEIRRPYSLSSYPATDRLPFITVKRIDNGEASRYIHQQLQPGDRVEILPPNGRFVLPAVFPGTLVFLAAGSGISPVLSLIKQALYESSSTVVLFYSNRSKESTIFYAELRALEAQSGGRLTIHWLFSNNKNLVKARLNRPMLEAWVKTTISDRSDVLFYTCGPFYYMEMIFITLITMGFTEEQLFKELFTAPDEEEEDDGSLVADEKAPEYMNAVIDLDLYGTHHRFALQAGETILEAALKQKIRLPYSCRNGMCSSCTVQMHAGQVYMHYNQVLTDKETASGRVLTCTAHPLSGIVRIEAG